MVRDMTSGSPMKIITMFAVPMFVGNVFQQVYNMVDSIVVGNFVGPQALAAVGACSGAFNLILALIVGLTSGMSVVVAQYFGAKNHVMVKKTFISAIIVNMSVGLAVSVVGVWLARPLLLLLGTPEDIMDDAVAYLTIMFLGTLANCMYNGMSSVLRALGDAVLPLLILIMASLMNVGLDLLFVLTFHMGVPGVALATVLSQLVSAVLCVIYVFIRLPMLRFGKKEFRPDWDVVREIVRIGVPAALSSSGVSISVMFMQRAINTYGSTVIAAYTSGNRAEQLGMCLSFSIGSSVGTFCGQNIGAKNFDRVKKGLHAGLIISFAYTITVGALMFIFSGFLSRLFSSDPAVIAISSECVRVTAVFAPMLGLVFIFQNFLRSAGDVTPTVWMSISEIVARSVLAFAFSALFGYHGIWWATPVGWTGSALIGYLRYRTGKWKAKLKVTTESVTEETAVKAG